MDKGDKDKGAASEVQSQNREPIPAPTIQLNNGQKMPILGLGTWKSEPGQVVTAVKVAIDAGYRHIDCAYFYENEKEVGMGIKEKLDQGVIKREDIWVTSKLWNTFHSPGAVETAIKTTLESLGLKYLDLYLIHWPMGFEEGGAMYPMDAERKKILFSKVDYLDTWKAMEGLVKKGLTKSIGVSNFNSQQIDRLVKSAKIMPVTNQVECHPYFNQKKLAAHCKKHNIILTAYCPFGSPNRPWAKPTDPLLLNEPVLTKMAKRISKTPAQIVLRYLIQIGTTPIPKSITASRIRENFRVFNFELAASDMKILDGFDRADGRAVSNDMFKDHPYYPFNLAY